MQADVIAASYPVVAGLLGFGAAGLAAAIVGMAWSVHARQIQLAGQLARRQFIVTGAVARPPEADLAPAPATEHINGTGGAGPAAPVVIDGPDTVLAGEQARYRVRPSGNRKVASWSVGGGAVAHSPDPAYPDDLLLIAEQPGTLLLTVRVRDGMMERRGTKSVSAVPDVAAPAPPFPLRLFLSGWGLIVVAVLVIGFAGALAALGNLSAADFIALTAPLAALLGVVALARGPADPGSQPAQRRDASWLRPHERDGRPPVADTVQQTIDQMIHPGTGRPD
jgi:hypothetical protein